MEAHEQLSPMTHTFSKSEAALQKRSKSNNMDTQNKTGKKLT